MEGQVGPAWEHTVKDPPAERFDRPIANRFIAGGLRKFGRQILRAGRPGVPTPLIGRHVLGEQIPGHSHRPTKPRRSATHIVDRRAPFLFLGIAGHGAARAVQDDAGRSLGEAPADIAGDVGVNPRLGGRYSFGR